jgi:CubicO group peptidase (beta-lactamase class C family)
VTVAARPAIVAWLPLLKRISSGAVRLEMSTLASARRGVRFSVTRVLPLIVLTGGCVAEKAPPSGAMLDSTAVGSGPRPAAAVVASAVDSLAARIVMDGLTPALGVAVVMDGATILAKSYGTADATNRVPADDRTLWYVASTSKSLTGFAASLLAHQGSIDFRAPITSLLPHAQWPTGVDASRLTLENFLAHTHRLRDNAIVFSSAFTGAFPESQYPALLRFSKPSGTEDLEYSNLGYNVVAMVIDAKRPEGWRRYLDSAVYRPAGMTETYARVSGLDRSRIAMPHELLADGRYVTEPFQKTDATMHAAGGHLATMGDLARWITVQMDSGVIDGERVFPAEAVALGQRVIAPQTREESKTFTYFVRDGWAAGWDVGSYQGERMVSRFGSFASTRSHLSFLPARRIGVAAQANGELASRATDILAAFAYDLERGDPNARAVAGERLQTLLDRRPGALAEIARTDSTRAARSYTLRRSLSDLAGSYRHPSYGTVTFELRGNDLYYEWGLLNGVGEVIDARSCSWRGCRYYNAVLIQVGDNDTAVEFDLPESGPATALKLREEKFIRQ